MKKSIISMLLVFAVLAFLVSCGGSESDNGSGGIYGYVMDSVTGEPVQNAYIDLDNLRIKQRYLTGTDGYFEFIDLPNSSSDDGYHPYSIEVNKNGYETFHSGNWNAYYGYRNIEVKDKMIRFDILLQPKD